MQERLAPAVEELLEQLRVQQEDVADTKKAINLLCKRMGKDPMFADVAVEQTTFGPLRPDQYYGRPLSTVAQEFLERRKQACPAEEIMRGLIQGGYDFKALNWQEKDWLRLFAISLAKNSKTFHKLPNGTFGLGTWYPEAAARREAAKQDKDKAITNDEAGEDAETADQR
jgi:hypothetical protein